MAQAPDAKPLPPPPAPEVEAAWEVPTADETAYPRDEDGESWLELLRDGQGLKTCRTCHGESRCEMIYYICSIIIAITIIININCYYYHFYFCFFLLSLILFSV